MGNNLKKRRFIPDRQPKTPKRELKESQQDSSAKIVSAIETQTSILSSDIKSSETNLAAQIAKSEIDTRLTVEGYGLALQENLQDGTTEIVSQIRKHTSSLNSELKSSENNMSSLIEKSEICTRRTLEDTEMALKESQQDCTTEILSQTASLGRKIDHLMDVTKRVNADCSKDKDIENRTSAGQDDYFKKCQGKYKRNIFYPTFTANSVD
ncbi:hypothetical protein DPMN_145988 [Dreissena polymorpha]|uniref:Uncharacterized protein n=1 Tax=Dreissena polymorpha TaxID=45954 RepID=A0A9D4F9H7_DREPO|nr:hypothetical protein DPMN_145988 [Dreissena polymorpha]